LNVRSKQEGVAAGRVSEAGKGAGPPLPYVTIGAPAPPRGRKTGGYGSMILRLATVLEYLANLAYNGQIGDFDMQVTKVTASEFQQALGS
jgi:hypothetical protein